MMVHPSHEPAVLSTIFPLGYKPKPGEKENPGRPERFPHITVNDANQQEMYEARGYVVQGEGNSASFQEASSGVPGDYAFNEYPKWIRTHDDEVLVHSKEEEHRLMGYNKVTKEVVVEQAIPKKKPGPPKGYKKKPKTDRMAVTD